MPTSAAVVGGRLDGVPEFLVFTGGQHEAGHLQDFVGGEALGNG
jgi:hypothetical protein